MLYLTEGFALCAILGLCVCVILTLFVAMYVIFHRIITPSPSKCWEVTYAPCITTFTGVFITFFL